MPLSAVAPTTLFDLIQVAPATRTAIALPEQNIQITYGALRRQVEAVAKIQRRLVAQAFSRAAL